MRVLGVDREMNPHLVERKMKVEDSSLIVYVETERESTMLMTRHFRVASVRILRLASNAFLQSVDLVMRTMEEFAPVPEGEDSQDEEPLQDVQGIELKGDGKGAGGGEEVQ